MAVAALENSGGSYCGELELLCSGNSKVKAKLWEYTIGDKS